MTDPLDELPIPPETGEGARLIAAALLGQADALQAFLEAHVPPLNSVVAPVLIEGPSRAPVLSVRLEARQVGENTVFVLVLG